VLPRADMGAHTPPVRTGPQPPLGPLAGAAAFWGIADTTPIKRRDGYDPNRTSAAQNCCWAKLTNNSRFAGGKSLL
jgi:hypothetical protein